MRVVSFLNMMVSWKFLFNSPKEITFRIRIYHCSANCQGVIWLEILKDSWSPVLINSEFLQLIEILTDFNPMDPLVGSTDTWCLINKTEHNRVVRQLVNQEICNITHLSWVQYEGAHCIFSLGCESSHPLKYKLLSICYTDSTLCLYLWWLGHSPKSSESTWGIVKHNKHDPEGTNNNKKHTRIQFMRGNIIISLLWFSILHSLL